MAENNIYEELKEVLQEIKDFLDENVATITPAVTALDGLGVPIKDLITELIELLGKLKTEIQNLDVSSIPGLSEISSFTGTVGGLLDTVATLLPDESGTIDGIKGVVDTVSGLPSLEEIKTEILSLLDAVVGHLNTLKAA